MTPVERAKRAITDSDLEECITAAVQAERNAGDLRLADATAALQAALEELAKVKQERDHIAGKLAGCKDCGGSGYVGGYANDGPLDGATCNHGNVLAAHDRQVAARVLRAEAAEWHESTDITHRAFAAGLIDSAEEYERGEREVPGE
jgi:hypothetical protein